MNTDVPKPPSEIGSTEPTLQKVATARRLLDLHRAIEIPVNDFCGWCLKPWPCADVRWSRVVLARAGRVDG